MVYACENKGGWEGQNLEHSSEGAYVRPGGPEEGIHVSHSGLFLKPP